MNDTISPKLMKLRFPSLFSFHRLSPWLTASQWRITLKSKGGPCAAPVPDPASITSESRLMKPSKIIHISNKHNMNLQRSKTKREGKLDTKTANLQKIHAGSSL